MEELFFSEGHGNKRIACCLHKPKKYNRTLIVICHGFSSSKTGSHGLLVEVARNLCNKGFKVLRFDFPCNGESEGNFEDNDFEEWTETILSLCKEQDYDYLGLLGNSMGGASIIHTQAKHKIADFLVGWVPGIAFSSLESTNTRIVKVGGVEYSEERGARVKMSFWKDIHKINFRKELLSLKVPSLLFFTEEDKYVPYGKVKVLTKGLSKNIELVIFKGVDHQFSDFEASQELVMKTLDFFDKQM